MGLAMSARSGAGSLKPRTGALYTIGLFRFPERAYSPLHILIPALMA